MVYQGSADFSNCDEASFGSGYFTHLSVYKGQD